MKIKIFKKKYVGYPSLKSIASHKGFWDHASNTATIPDGYTVETDGILWSIRKNEEANQG